jgi:hypothetical protein
MSTAVALPQTVIVNRRVHYTIVAGRKMYCIQVNCDGTHHFYCSCDH